MPRPPARPFDVAVVGGGIVGLATARALASRPGRRVVVLEAETRLARHQSGRNSGVVHSGLYYRPGSRKARLCREGAEALFRFCAERGLPHRRTGKLVVAATPAELPRLEELERRGRANGLAGLRRLRGGELGEVEPHAAGAGGLWVPATGVVDFARVCEALAEEVRSAGGEVRTGARLAAARAAAGVWALETSAGALECRFLVACAGLQADRVARLCGLAPGLAIVPFRGDYWRLVAGRRRQVRGLIYPVPDPGLPFLGVHLTRRIDGAVEAGPNAAPALAREGYRRWSFSPRDAVALAGYPGFWRLARRHWRSGAAEIRRALSRKAVAAAAARLVPEVRPRDLERAGCGVRAQAVERSGELVDDFRLLEGERALHVLNAPSPAATAALAIGRELAERVERAGGI